jgi:hypothetical protein
VSGRRDILMICRVLDQGIWNAEDDMNVNTSHEGS